jgi:hypothetical protein
LCNEYANPANQTGIAGLVLEYLDPAEGWSTTAVAASARCLREKPTLLVQQVFTLILYVEQ